jgi:hypothetical protein
LLFKEESASNVIYAVKLSHNEHAKLFEIKMPFDHLLANNNLTDKADKTILGYTNGKIMVAVSQLIFYVDVSKHIFIEKPANRLSEMNP